MKYAFAISDTAAKAVNPSALSSEITGGGISTALRSIETSGDDLVIVFVDALSAEDESRLDAIVATHANPRASQLTPRRETVALEITAAGIDQATATQLDADRNIITTINAGGGVRLPKVSDDLAFAVLVANRGAGTCRVYPAAGGEIDALGLDAAFQLDAGLARRFYNAGNKWI
jgi:hypothetical protein